jgi:hypothetical protein
MWGLRFFEDIKKSWCDKMTSFYVISHNSQIMTTYDIIDCGCDTSLTHQHQQVIPLPWILVGEKVRKCMSLRFFVRLWGSPGSNVIFFLEGVRLFLGINIF